MTTPKITVTVDTTADTYEFTTDPYVKPPDEPLPVDRLGDITIQAGGSQNNITLQAVVPSTAVVTTPFDPALQPVTSTGDTYQLSAIGMVTLSVPTYGGRPLTGEPLTVAAHIDLTLTETGSTTDLISYGALVTLIIEGISQPQVVTVPDGLFVGHGTQVEVDPGGSTFTLADVEEKEYPVSTESASSKLIPLIGTINVGSTKKPKA